MVIAYGGMVKHRNNKRNGHSLAALQSHGYTMVKDRRRNALDFWSHDDMFSKFPGPPHSLVASHEDLATFPTTTTDRIHIIVWSSERACRADAGGADASFRLECRAVAACVYS